MNERAYQLRIRQQRGLTLVEIMIAMAIALFLLAGLMIMVQNTRDVFGKQSQLAMLQDNERMAMTIIADVVQQAGYFPDPTTYTAGIVPIPITGTHQSAAPGDTISITYRTHSTAVGSGDGILNCSGGSNTTGNDQSYTNVFSVNSGQLVCTMNTFAYPLVGGITNLSVLYGVRMNAASNCLDCVDTYLDAAQVTTAAAWPNVLSVIVKLTFTNPLYTGADQQPATITIQRVITLMNKSGVAL